MKRTVLGLLFLVIGIVIIAAVLAPVGFALAAHLPAPSISFPLLITGIALAVFGALLIDPVGVGAGITVVTVKLGNTGLPWIGRRAGDANPPATVTVTGASAATPTPPAVTLPVDGDKP